MLALGLLYQTLSSHGGLPVTRLLLQTIRYQGMIKSFFLSLHLALTPRVFGLAVLFAICVFQLYLAIPGPYQTQRYDAGSHTERVLSDIGLYR